MSSIHADIYLDLHSKGSRASHEHADRGSDWTESGYNGRSIKLWSAQADDGTWVCEYTIVEFWPTRAFSESGYPVGDYRTRDEAEAAALEIARGVINSRDPVRDPPQLNRFSLSHS
ncbi:MAG: hypothetical protein H8K04_12260 [Nitrospira sp.]